MEQTPRAEFFHIAGSNAQEYLSPDLVNFILNTSSYFKLNNKFKESVVSPREVSTSVSQPFTLKYTPIQVEDNQNAYRAKFQINVGDSRVLDLGSCYFDIRGTIDRGPSFKPYGGTAYNYLAPKGSNCNFTRIINNNRYLSCQTTLSTNFQTDIQTTATALLPNLTAVLPSPSDSDAGAQFGNVQCVSYQRCIEPEAGNYDQNAPVDVNCYGAYGVPINNQGHLTAAAPKIYGLKKANQGGVTFPTAVVATDSIRPSYPDTRIISYDPLQTSTIRMGNKVNFIGFRDNFIGMMYYDTSACSGNLSSLDGNFNLVIDTQDRNTELSYQHLLADLHARENYFSLWNEAVDNYDQSVRIFTNEGYEEAPLDAVSTSTARNGTDSGGLTERDAGNANWQDVNNATALIGVGPTCDSEINLQAHLMKDFIYSNITQYLPNQYQRPVNIPQGVGYPQRGNNPNSYQYKNLSIPAPNVVDLFTNLGGRWSVDVMDTVNPFNHHRNSGLKYRSMLLGNSRYSEFHIQVPQKFFAIKNLVLTSGTYNYEWYFRKDPNMVLQSTLGNDLRADGVQLHYNAISLYCPFFPMNHELVNRLELMLRASQNDQTFMDSLGAKNMFYAVPANTSEVVISIPNQTWEGFKGWRFGRVKAAECSIPGSSYDNTLRYSGSMPHLDGTYYLNHTFRSVQFYFNTSTSWPGNDRLLTPNQIEIKRNIGDDVQGYCVAQSNLTKDMFLIQMSANYNQGYHGYQLPSGRLYKDNDFLRNFEPMQIQSPDFAANNIFNLVNPLDGTGAIVNNSGFTLDKKKVSDLGIVSGCPYPANWPYPLIGPHALAANNIFSYKKFLIDKYLWTIPFSSNFMYMGDLTDLGQSPVFTDESKNLTITFSVDPMNEDTYIHVLYGVFDCVRVNQPVRNRVSIYYFRTPFASGGSVR